MGALDLGQVFGGVSQSLTSGAGVAAAAGVGIMAIAQGVKFAIGLFRRTGPEHWTSGYARAVETGQTRRWNKEHAGAIRRARGERFLREVRREGRRKWAEGTGGKS